MESWMFLKKLVQFWKSAVIQKPTIPLLTVFFFSFDNGTSNSYSFLGSILRENVFMWAYSCW